MAVDPTIPESSLADQALALLSAGLTITSAGTPARSGTYATDAAAQREVTGEVVSLMLNGTFADGETAIDWVDIAGATHNFDVSSFKDLATKIGAFAQPCLRIIRTGAGTLPSAEATIA